MFSLIRADIFFIFPRVFVHLQAKHTSYEKTIILFTLILCCMTACTGSQKKKIL